MIAVKHIVLSDSTLGILMVAAQNGDRVAYRRLLVVVGVRAMEACMQDGLAQALGAAEMEAFACGILQTVHTALATFDPRQSFDIWLSAIISARLARSRQQHRAVLRAKAGCAEGIWYRRMFARWAGAAATLQMDAIPAETLRAE